ncbi:hypothetical protein [Bradyrhizobium sp. Rc2d]|uniref:COG3904 family protein n=1 Tax=Bradyrhizobium sp. Rc2d TaxID=1855321 RepID=UPI00115FA5EE|nr:hypothetical protein [Bradyrhizobium sp. Rc2d]
MSASPIWAQSTNGASIGPCGLAIGKWASPKEACALVHKDDGVEAYQKYWEGVFITVKPRSIEFYESNCSVKTAKRQGFKCVLNLSCSSEGEQFARSQVIDIRDEATFRLPGKALPKRKWDSNQYSYCDPSSTDVDGTNPRHAEPKTSESPKVASDGPDRMSFEGIPPRRDLAFVLGNGWVIYGDGSIDADASKRLEAFLAANHVPERSQLNLNSPGGSLFGGMELGKVIRKYQLRTAVAAKNSSDSDMAPGGCFSACALAFLGGEFRYLSKGSRYGVHRFAFKNNSTSDGMDIAQIASAAVVQYLRDMEIDTKLFTLASSAGPSEIFEPTPSQLSELNVVNNGVTRPKWTVESISDGIYLKGERNTVFGINKFILTCQSKNVGLYIIFDPQNREQEVLRFTADYLVVDGVRARIDHARAFRSVKNGWINAGYTLTEGQLSAIANAKTVGVAMQPSAESPIFLGFDAMPVETGAAKMQGFIRACR